MIGSLEKEVFPLLGKLPVTEIDEPMVLFGSAQDREARGDRDRAPGAPADLGSLCPCHCRRRGITRSGRSGDQGAEARAARRKRPALLSIEALHD
ncbi:MAG: hypothetical protein IPO97_05295 [Sphingomonadales bacterium]|nr:hypothetical protein [Sphingomonadales bacterium]